MKDRVRVRLDDDLTKYDKRLTPGQEGVTCQPTDVWARGFPARFTGVAFDCGARLDVMWSGLTILDPEVIAEMEQHRKETEAKIASATSAEWHVGPRGGFRHLQYKYPGGSTSISDRAEAKRVAGIIEAAGVVITTVRAA